MSSEKYTSSTGARGLEVRGCNKSKQKIGVYE